MTHRPRQPGAGTGCNSNDVPRTSSQPGEEYRRPADRLVARRAAARCYKEKQMITLGIILLVIGLLVASLNVLVTIGVVLIVVGLILALLGKSGRAVGGRSHWW